MAHRYTTCPTCGSDAIRPVCRDVTRAYRGQSYTVPQLTFQECPVCGEVIYDHAAMQKIEAYSPAYAKRRCSTPRAVSS